MGYLENDNWLEAASEHLENAIAAGDISLAKEIIADTFDAGFDAEARAMNTRLRTAVTEKEI